MAGDALDQLVIGDRFAIAEDHRRHLGVEDRMRQQAGAVPDDLDVLAGGVKNLQHALVGHQLEERGEVDAVGQRVDHDGLLGARQLCHAQQRVIGRLAKKFGIDGDGGVPAEPLAGGGQLWRLGNQLHGCSITQLAGLVAPC